MLGRVFRDLADELDWTESAAKQESFFCELRDRYSLMNVAYLGVNLPKKNFQSFFFHATYNEDWVKHYQTNNYVSIDPIVRKGFFGLMPIDWSDTSSLDKNQKKLFHEAKEFRVGNRGLTFPLHGQNNETAIFSITAEMSETDWHDFKTNHLRDMRIAADVFHQSIVSKASGEERIQKVALTRRERECLRWCAEGKTREDIADILGVSSRVVKFHLEGARSKLGCLNTTHSVASAVLRGFI
jgi:DNA-binding CsgD family transcriptional regulator